MCGLLLNMVAFKAGADEIKVEYLSTNHQDRSTCQALFRKENISFENYLDYYKLIKVSVPADIEQKPYFTKQLNSNDKLSIYEIKSGQDMI